MQKFLFSAFSLVAVIVLVLASGAVGRITAPASAGAIVDPNTLQPVPPNATCREAGGQVICDTFLVEEVVNEPIADFDLPCGTIYETSHFRGDGTRWYVDGKVVRRHVAASVEGTWSLSPTGAGPTVKISGSSSEVDRLDDAWRSFHRRHHAQQRQRLQDQRPRLRRDQPRRGSHVPRRNTPWNHTGVPVHARD